MIRVVCIDCQIETLAGGESGARAIVDLHRIAQPGHMTVMVPA